ncbi:transcription antitermination factor NusB [Candidatus Symbiobacter mobilis]|uniref:Transcription antitermination protein NusB n=1 Tax=Candidatus Symbiobacter mobilis CR TaxID=946483 RepID=U5N7H2_9BURK|nr:transcription antitermination factor NusB [Candidatus Symbiobacter mobilis]AGX87471.1 N utilization substance protein B [Candidatus Symbiobacter mobilis CR]
MRHPPPSDPSKPPPGTPHTPLTEARKAVGKSDRSRARGFALQALYQVLVGNNPVAEVDPFTRELVGFSKCDTDHFQALLHGCAAESEDLDALIAPMLDRKLTELSPIERAAMWIGAYELLHHPDIPARVVLNEAIELAKEFGGTDGHRYVNGVLHALARRLRPTEVATDGPRRFR